MTEQFSRLDARGLRRLSTVADAATRPAGLFPPDINKWTSRSHTLKSERHRIPELIASRAMGASELMVLESPRLKEALISLRARTTKLRFTRGNEAAISAMFRLAINRELSTSLGSLYAPAPQRARIAWELDGAVRHQLERKIAGIPGVLKRTSQLAFVRRTDSAEKMPLPIFAFHALREAKGGSPHALLEAARKAREDADVAYIRRWLAQLEKKAAAGQNVTEELEATKKEIERDLGRKKVGSWLRSLLSQISISVKWDPAKHELSATLPGGEIFEGVTYWYNTRRKYLAAMARGLADEERLGARLLQQMGRVLL